MLLLSACATTNELSGVKETEIQHKAYYGTWKIVNVVLKNGEIKDFSNGPADYVHINETEIVEEISGYGLNNYNYIENNNIIIVMAENRVSKWSILKSTENTMELETPAGRYVLVRKVE